jgi:hypothetical protein
VVDEDFRHGMFEYALWGVLWFQRHFDRALAHQRAKPGRSIRSAAADFHIGIMGLGEIGGYIATSWPASAIGSPAGRAVKSSWLASPAIAARRRSTTFLVAGRAD